MTSTVARAGVCSSRWLQPLHIVCPGFWATFPDVLFLGSCEFVLLQKDRFLRIGEPLIINHRKSATPMCYIHLSLDVSGNDMGMVVLPSNPKEASFRMGDDAATLPSHVRNG